MVTRMFGSGLAVLLLLSASSGEPAPADVAVRGPAPARSGTAAEVHAERVGFIWPVEGAVTSPFGSPRPWGSHRGVDIKAPGGTPIRAAAAGTVVFSGRESSYGRIIEIAHPNGLSTVYAHNSANFVRAGDKVKTGTVIGAVGRTGRATADHLHFEIRRQGVARDPLPLLQHPPAALMIAKRHDAKAPAHHRPASEINSAKAAAKRA